jgi:hypothetical protein
LFLSKAILFSVRARNADPEDEERGADVSLADLTSFDRPNELSPSRSRSPSAPCTNDVLMRLQLGLDSRHDSNRLLPPPMEGEGVRGGSLEGCDSAPCGDLSTTDSDRSSWVCMLGRGEGYGEGSDDREESHRARALRPLDMYRLLILFEHQLQLHL